MAAALAKRKLADRLGCEPEELQDRGIEIASCGTGAPSGMPISQHAAEILSERHLEADDHRSRPMTVDALLAADYIWVMTRAHQDAARAAAPEAAGRVCLLDPDGEDIADRMGGEVGTYRT
jgi:protein-tyrosine-phosphatase